MRRLLLAFLGCAWAIGGSSEGDLRHLDFANHDYPWRDEDSPPVSETDSSPGRETHSSPDIVQWLSTSESSRVRLVHGRWESPDSVQEAASGFELPFAGVTLDEVVYGDLTGDSRDEAVVVLRFDSGGTQYYYWVYIYSGTARRPRLLAYFLARERADYGLYRVYIRDHCLLVEVYDPDKRQGDCCSSGFVRSRYKWSKNAFVMLGATEKGTPESVSRRRVSTFGMPYDQMRR